VMAEANGLSAPYRLQVGRTLIIPGVSVPRAAGPPQSMAGLPATRPPDAPPPSMQSDYPPPATTDNRSVSAAPPAPLSEPSAARPGAADPTAPPRPVAETSDANRIEAPSTPGSGAFVWPIRGHILATYGVKSDGTHNDGINIAAPRGAAIQAVDAGTVAYAGNELRGYGNLILIKHANGWISAYAHCDQIMVKRGEKVARGEVIARVGSTGNVTLPQLHFELRRGQHAVDPREFLPPLSTAAMEDRRSS
jgi:murein DD-endopeptidase MepM/ murein hydrolase activator NlpD